MRAVYFEEFGKEFRVGELPDPRPAPDGVLIAVAACGVCRSDWHGWQGHDADITSLPHVPGHELAGEVVEVGSEVTRVQVGQRVTIPFVAGCGHCDLCRSGDPQVCPDQYQPGFSGWGGFAEFVAVRYADFNMVPLPEAVSWESAASLGCRMSTAYRAVVQQGRLVEGEWLVVHGCGGLGLSAVMIGAAKGARVIGVDIQPEALSLAEQVGAEFVLNASAIASVPEAIHELTLGGADLSLDALGGAETSRNSLLSLRRRGRHVQVGLLAGRDASPRVPLERLLAWELEILGSHGLSASSYSDLLKMVANGDLDPGRLVKQIVRLEDVPASLQSLGSFSHAGVSIARVRP